MPEPADIGIDRLRRRVCPQLAAGIVVVLSFAPDGTPALSAIRNRGSMNWRQIWTGRVGTMRGWPAGAPTGSAGLETDQNPVDIVWRRTRAAVEPCDGHAGA